MFKEFKEFITRGNVVDLAVAVVIGAAFGAITTSLVQDVITPPLGLLMQGIDFSQLGIVLGSEEYESIPAAIEAGAPVIKYGSFINTMINFLVVAAAMFLVVKAVNKLQNLTKKAAEEEAAAEEPAAPSEDIVLLTEIRDLLKERA